ncbi:polysaccharide deacetylase family protein, partial [Streptomyces sp. NPDC001719]
MSAEMKNSPHRIHWLLLAIAVLIFSGALLVEGYTQYDPTVRPRTGVWAGRAAVDGSSALAKIAPVIDPTCGRAASPHDKTLSLTFDGGPDPRWTPKILDVLKKYNIKATFFMIGAEIARYPEIVRRTQAEGHQLALSSFTHSGLDTAASWRRKLEIDQSRLALAAATGSTSRLYRSPYTSTDGAMVSLSKLAAKPGDCRGYLVVLSTQDSQDWRHPGVRAIVNNAMPEDDHGQIVAMRDAGNDRSQTVEALEEYIPLVRSKEFTFTTVTQAVHHSEVDQKASTFDQLRGVLVIFTLQGSALLVQWMTWLTFSVGTLYLLRMLAVLIASHRHSRERSGGWGAQVADPLTVIVPVYNEQAGVEAVVRSLVASDYPGEVEVIVVDDGSTDCTASLVESLHLSRVRVIRQSNAGKPAALNNGLWHASFDLIVMVDGDTVFKPNTARILVQPFADPQVGAVSGNTKVGNRNSLLGTWQHIEYVIGFNLDRRLFDLAKCMPTVPGAIGAFRRQALLECGG